MFLVNTVLIIIVLFLNFLHDWRLEETENFIRIPPITSPTDSMGAELVSSESNPSRRMVDAIKRTPLFIEGRRRVDQETVAETLWILVDGAQSSVELVGTIEANGQDTVAFMLDGDETVWLRENEHLGDWQIQEIVQKEVRLRKQQEILILRPRKDTDVDASPENS